MGKPLVPWMGGKRRLAKKILPLIPEHQCYVEPFAGGAAILFAKEPSKVEVLNDLNSDLVTLYRCVKHHFEELYRQFKWTLVSREQWEWLRDTPPETLTDIQRAARFLYVLKLSFGAKVDGKPTFGTATTAAPKFNLLTLERDLEDCHLRLNRVLIERLDWMKCIDKYDRPHTFFYLDPPYWQTANYGQDFPFEEYQKMADLPKTKQGKFMVSINDHPDIRTVFKGWNMHTAEKLYTVGKGNAHKAKELILTSY